MLVACPRAHAMKSCWNPHTICGQAKRSLLLRLQSSRRFHSVCCLRQDADVNLIDAIVHVDVRGISICAPPVRLVAKSALRCDQVDVFQTIEPQY